MLLLPVFECVGLAPGGDQLAGGQIVMIEIALETFLSGYAFFDGERSEPG